MATLSADEVLARLGELGHNYNPEKQHYKFSVLAGNTIVLFDPKGTRRELPAEGAEAFIERGFTTSRASKSKE